MVSRSPAPAAPAPGPPQAPPVTATSAGPWRRGAVAIDRGLGLQMSAAAAALEAAAPRAAALARLPRAAVLADLLERVALAVTEGTWRHERVLAEAAAAEEERRRCLEAVAARQCHVGSRSTSGRWSHLGWLQDDGTPLALSREGGQVVLATGTIGAGKTQALLAFLEAALRPRPALTSPELPPTAAVLFHCDLTGVTLPEVLHGLRPNDRPDDLRLLAESLWVGPAALPAVRLLVPADQLDDTYARVRQELGEVPANLRIHPLRLRLGDLGALGLEALLGLDPDDPPRYLQDTLAQALALGPHLTCAALAAMIEENPALTDHLREMALSRLRLLERIEDPRADLWDLVEPGVLTVVSLSGRWLARGEALPLIVALINAFAQPSPRHGPFQRIIAVDEVNRLRGAPALWAALVTTARQVRHFGSVLWLSGQDLLNVPGELLALATQVLCFRLRSPRIFAHLRGHIAGFGRVRFSRVSRLLPGHALWLASEASDPRLRGRAQHVYIRPPTCAHGGHTRAVL